MNIAHASSLAMTQTALKTLLEGMSQQNLPDVEVSNCKFRNYSTLYFGSEACFQQLTVFYFS